MLIKWTRNKKEEKNEKNKTNDNQPLTICFLLPITLQWKINK